MASRFVKGTVPPGRPTPFRRAGAPAPPAPVPATSHWYVKLGLLLLGAVMLSLSFAPYKQFYLAPFGLVPWLVVLGACRSQWRAFGWGWVGGVLFFAGNMWWLLYVTVPGTLALVVILALYPAAAGWLIRGLGLLRGATPGELARGEAAGDAAPAGEARPGPSPTGLRALLAVFGIAVVWVAVAEWLRGTWPFQGLPWLYLGYTQTPALPGCQIADATGVYGVSFWVLGVNAWVALFFLNRLSARGLLAAGGAVLAVLLGVFGYGLFRFSQKTTYPGPDVLVVQSNYPQTNTGEKGAPALERYLFHKQTTERRLAAPGARIDLVVWSETMMPPINRDARDRFRGELFDRSADLDQIHHDLMGMAAQWRAGFLVGSAYAGDFEPRTGAHGSHYLYPADTRNTAVYYERSGTPSGTRYDKIHLVPFGEYIPFKESVPWLYRLLISLGPPDMEDYQLRRGSESAPTLFTLPPPGQEFAWHDGEPVGPGDAAPATQSSRGAARPWRFVTPICFEDIDGPLVAWMFRAHPGPAGTGREPPASGAKQADFIVNITNDGWFKANEMPQHLQAAAFRSIENRAPTARSVNTGISGFIDSLGRIDPAGLVPAGAEGASSAVLQLDSRTTLYTRFGDVFAFAVAAVAGLMCLAGAARWGLRRRAGRAR